MRIFLWLQMLLFAAIFVYATPLCAAGRVPVTISSDSKLFLRVLTRPAATLYQDKEGKTVLESNLPTFRSFFVYTRPGGEELATGSGWYEVGTDDKGSIRGWIKADDVFEWKQTMCLSYTHPEGRHPVLMFEDEEYLKTLAQMPAKERVAKTEALYGSIDQAASEGKTLPKNFPVLSMEPKRAVDAGKNFTLLPILDHASIEIEEREARLLSIAAVSSTAKDRVKSDLRSNTAYVQSAATTSASQSATLKDMRFDVVWVIDTTRSMGPYINAARKVMGDISKTIGTQPELRDKVVFGAWGYRDSAEIEGLEYVTRNFTPKLLPVEEFLTAMSKIKETNVDSRVFDEDVFSGVNDALNKTAWRDNAVRIVILVGDAPGHELGHKWNVSGFDAQTLRALASERKVNFYALHLNHPKAKKFNRLAQRQFSTLAQNPGTERSMYWKITSTDLEAFEQASRDITESVTLFMSSILEKAKNVEAAPAAALPEAPKQDTKQETIGQEGGEMAALEGNDEPEGVNPTRADVKASLEAASVLWLGAQMNVAPPRDIEAYVVDKDLLAPAHQSLEVRLLLTKTQLDTLATLLQEVLTAGATNQISGEDFFTSLQAASAVAARDPEMLSKASTLGSSGMIPSFLQGLPYKSRLMDMNNELWASWSPDEQDAFLNNLEAKIKAYAAIHDDSSLWTALNEGDDPADYVAPVLLELMP